MFREIFNSTSAETYSSIALVIFVAVFVLTTIWVLTRRRSTVKRWSNLPLEDDPQTSCGIHNQASKKPHQCCGKCKKD